jgi:hypothetical protein
VTRVATRGGTSPILPALLAVAASILLMGCSEGEPPGQAATPTPAASYTGPGSVRAIMDGTQMHLEGVGVGVGNIWEDEYVTAAGARNRGPTAGLFIAIEGDPSKNRHLRVYDGFEVDVPGYRLHIVAIRESGVEIAVIKLPE